MDLPGVGAGKMGVDANELRENKVHDFIFFFFLHNILFGWGHVFWGFVRDGYA